MKTIACVVCGKRANVAYEIVHETYCPFCNSTGTVDVALAETFNKPHIVLEPLDVVRTSVDIIGTIMEVHPDGRTLTIERADMDGELVSIGVDEICMLWKHKS